MKLPIICLTCAIQGVADERPIKVVEVRDDGRYETICDNGHHIVIVLQQLKFEILFEIGAYAIADGYYREGVSSFTSSLERFYEFVIRVILHAKGLSDESINFTWNTIARQSERQLGAFVALYASEYQKLPSLLTNKQVEFRNDVIHRGIIPSRDQAVLYGQQVLDALRPILHEIKEKYRNSIHKVISVHILQCRNCGDAPNQPISTMFVETIISLAVADPKHDERSLEDAISNLRRW